MPRKRPSEEIRCWGRNASTRMADEELEAIVGE